MRTFSLGQVMKDLGEIQTFIQNGPGIIFRDLSSLELFPDFYQGLPIGEGHIPDRYASEKTALTVALCFSKKSRTSLWSKWTAVTGNLAVWGCYGR